MRKLPSALAVLVLALPAGAPARAETSCDLAEAAQGKVVTVRGTIKSIDTDRGDRSYWVVVTLKDRCGPADVSVSTKQSPRCRVGATVSVAGSLMGTAERLIEAQRIVCVK